MGSARLCLRRIALLIGLDHMKFYVFFVIRKRGEITSKIYISKHFSLVGLFPSQKELDSVAILS